MTGRSRVWLVAQREMRERGRSRAFRISAVLMIIIVVGMLTLPGLLIGDGSREVGLAGSTPAGLPAAIEAQGDAVGVPLRLHRFAGAAAGEEAVRQGDVDVLVVGADRLVWRRRTDNELQAVLTAAIHLVGMQERAAAAGIDSGTFLGLIAPVRVSSVELGSVAGRSVDDEAAAMAMTIVLLLALSTYGSFVLTGVVEEKTSRVVEVLLARIPARTLLVGKVTGIGLLGLAQLGVMALAALATTTVTDSVEIPAVRGVVLIWGLVWFVLGYAIFAMAYGALGSLVSRTEDAQSAAGPVNALLVGAYFISFVGVGRPDGAVATVTSFVPVTAPFAMPNRVAMGATAWWEPPAAALLAIATIVGTARLAGRIYEAAILHSGPTVRLREVWRRTRQAPRLSQSMPNRAKGPYREGTESLWETRAGARSVGDGNG